MAQADMQGVRPVGVHRDQIPKHFIIWLDKHIGKADECVLLKRSLFMTMDPTTGLFERNLNEDDINRSIAFDAALFVQLDQVEFLFQVFVDIEKCYNVIKDNQDRHIFFITSGTKGQIIVPSVVANFDGLFGPTNRIYIFCGNTLMSEVDGVDPPAHLWVLNFLEYILMFNHQDDLLARMVSEIGNYFNREAQRFDESQQLNNARQYYEWAKRMYQRLERIEPIRKTADIREIDQRLDDIERRLNPENYSEDDPPGNEPDSPHPAEENFHAETYFPTED